MSDPFSRLTEALADRYRVEREIGVGGAARVYTAWDVKHERRVALKILRPEMGATVTAERFDREVKLLSQLRHPNILTLIDSGDAGGHLFYVMPYIEGESLRDVMSRGPLPAGEAVRLLRDVADALAYAHRRGIVHRDVKPENVLIDHRHALVADFGIARALSADAGPDSVRRLTVAGRTLGSPNYMAPEQVAGNPDADGRADVYAFGIVAYELLSGRLPYDARNAALMLAAHLHQEPIPLAKVCPDMPPALAKLVMRCLEKEPKARCASSDEILEAFERILSPEPAAVPRGAGRGVSPVAIGAAASIVVAVAAVGWALRAQRSVAFEHWAHEVAAPAIRQLLAADSVFPAWRLAQQVEARNRNEDAVAEFWPRLAVTTDLFSQPSGARVAVRAVRGADTSWVEVGETPLSGARLPRAPVRLRLEKAGWATWDSAVDWRALPTHVRLQSR